MNNDEKTQSFISRITDDLLINDIDATNSTKKQINETIRQKSKNNDTFAERFKDAKKRIGLNTDDISLVKTKPKIK